MKLNSALIRLIAILSLIGASVVEARYKSHRRKLVSVWGEKIVKYFDLENKLIADEYYQSENEKNYKYEVDLKGCQDLDQINDFFFMTYSGNKTMKDKELENLISYHVNKSPRDQDIENRAKRNLCKRKRVIFSIYILNWNLLFIS